MSNEEQNQNTAQEAKRPIHKRLVMKPFLAEKHCGMRISASGILLRVGGSLKFSAHEMDRDLKEMAERYYAGDIKVVDEFLQLYCLDDNRPAS
ncbi:MAG: hypothetical protein GY954_08070 [Alteromonas sp.]|nr:hypothetical protein [Alteromonas sp.]